MLRGTALGVVATTAITFSAIARQTPPHPPAAATTGAQDILVSRQLLESQHLSIGDVVSLSAHANGDRPRRFRIVGSYEPTPDPMRLGAVRHEVRLHLPDLLSMTVDAGDRSDDDSVDRINIAVADQEAIPEVRDRLAGQLPGVVVTSAGGGRAEPFVVLERFHFAIAIVTLVASSIFLLALMVMIADQRRSVVGILRLMGFRRSRILLHVLTEAIVVAALGALFGVLLSALLQDSVNRFFQWRYDTTLVFVRITTGIALRSVAMAVPLGVLATLAASWTILRRDVLALTRR